MKVSWRTWLDFARKHQLMRFKQAFTRRGLSDLFFVWRKHIRGELVAVLYTKTSESDGDLMIGLLSLIVVTSLWPIFPAYPVPQGPICDDSSQLAIFHSSAGLQLTTHSAHGYLHLRKLPVLGLDREETRGSRNLLEMRNESPLNYLYSTTIIKTSGNLVQRLIFQQPIWQKEGDVK